MQVTQRVLPAVPVQTFQATLMRLDKPLTVPVAAPTGALPDVGGIVVGMRPSLVAGLEAVQTWMRDYPYTCLEQRVSRAVALHDAKLWNGVVAELPSFVDSDGLLKYFPMMQQGSDVLTSYVLAVTNEAGLKIPDPIEEQMRGGLQGFVEGKIIRDESIQTVDLPMRKLAAIEALTRYRKNRAVAARQHHHRAESVAGFRGARLVEHPVAHRVDSRSAEAHRRGGADHSRAAELAGHRDAVFERPTQ